MAAAQEPDYHADARSLLENAKQASLATAQGNRPYAALVTPAFLPDHLTPILLLSEMSVHTRQLRANPACALLVTGEAATENPQTAPRLCLAGTAAPAEDESARNFYLSVHPYASLYADFGDFAFWRLEIETAHYIGGFAAACMLDLALLRATSGKRIKS